MNKFTKFKKLAVALTLAFGSVVSMAITVFADSAEGGGGTSLSLWENPQFYTFIAVVVAFLGIFGSCVAHFFFRKRKNVSFF